MTLLTAGGVQGGQRLAVFHVLHFTSLLISPHIATYTLVLLLILLRLLLVTAPHLTILLAHTHLHTVTYHRKSLLTHTNTHLI